MTRDEAPRLAGKTVGVMGSGTDAHEGLSGPLGTLLASLGVNLLTGGGAGVMEAVARAFVAAMPSRGISIGVLPASSRDVSRVAAGYPNAFVQLPIVTHLSQRGREGHLSGSRNHINILTSDAIIALPGSYGTESELLLALQYQKKAAIFYETESQIERFTVNVPRFKRLGDVEAFLRFALDLSSV